MSFIKTQQELRANLFEQIKDVIEAAEAENATLRIRIAELESLCKEYVQAIQSHIDKEKNGSK